MNKKKLFLIPIILYIALIVIVSINRSSKLNERSDFFVYWKTGLNFIQGNELYPKDSPNRAFIYPPFAAFIFQVLATAPFNTSALIFMLFNNIVLPVIVIFLLFRILQNYKLNRKTFLWPVILSILASFNFYWNNLNMLQVNFLLFTLSLAGIFFISEKKYSIAAIFFVVATFIKVYPVFLLLYVFFLSPTKKLIISATIAGILCISLPTLERGIDKGIGDHKTYYETFLKEFKEGKVIPDLKNHSVKAFLVKASIPSSLYETSDFKLQKSVGNLILLFMLGLLSFSIYRQIKQNQKDFSLLILSSIFIFTHMISGITWAAHYVTAIFWYLPLFLIDRKKLAYNNLRIFHVFLMVVAFFLAIEGSDTTGKALYAFLRTYDIFVIFPIILFTYYLILYIMGEGKFMRENAA